MKILLEAKSKMTHPVLEFNKSQWLKQHVEFNTQKIITAEKKCGKDGKALYKVTNMLYTENQWET